MDQVNITVYSSLVIVQLVSDSIFGDVALDGLDSVKHETDEHDRKLDGMINLYLGGRAATGQPDSMRTVYGLRSTVAADSWC